MSGHTHLADPAIVDQYAVHPEESPALYRLVVQERHKYRTRTQLVVLPEFEQLTHHNQVMDLIDRAHPLEAAASFLSEKFELATKHDLFKEACQRKVICDQTAFQETAKEWCLNGVHRAIALWLSVCREFARDLQNRYPTNNRNLDHAQLDELCYSCIAFVVSQLYFPTPGGFMLTVASHGIGTK